MNSVYIIMLILNIDLSKNNDLFILTKWEEKIMGMGGGWEWWGIKEKCEILFFHREHLIANCRKLKSQEVAA